MQTPYRTIEELLSLIDEPNRTSCMLLFSAELKRFQESHGSTNNHQAWPGGYFDHIQDGMNVCVVLYNALNDQRPLPFSLSDALLVFFLHDIEKPWVYTPGDDGQLHVVPAMQDRRARHDFRLLKLHEYHIELTPDQLNALQYVEGENADYQSRKRVMGSAWLSLPSGRYHERADLVRPPTPQG